MTVFAFHLGPRVPAIVSFLFSSFGVSSGFSFFMKQTSVSPGTFLGFEQDVDMNSTIDYQSHQATKRLLLMKPYITIRSDLQKQWFW